MELSFSFDRYYQACAPIKCIYSQVTRKNGFIATILLLISSIGGLTTILRLLTPVLIKIAVNLKRSKAQKQSKQQQQVRLKLIHRLKIALCNLVKLLYNTLIDLNIFPLRVFGSRVDRRQAKFFGQITTRLCIICLVTSIIVLAVYSVTQPQTITKVFDKPTVDTYNNLLLKYNNSLHCRCSSISSVYDRFIKIKPVYHQICSSEFVSQEWRTIIAKSLIPDLSIYLIKDYRRFISSHFQFLCNLCDLAIKSMNNTIDQLLSSFLVTNELLSSHELDMRIELLINQTRSNAPVDFRNRLFLLQAASHATPIISTYGTNYRYITPWLNMSSSTAMTYALTYDNNCSCALYMTCTTQAGFFSQNETDFASIKGLKTGCTPSEALFASTLECFYDLSCINLIQEYTSAVNNSMNYSLLSIENSRFSINSTVMDLVNDLFMENWTTIINYSSYFIQCSPVSCLHSYKQQYSLLYTITLLLGLCDGLTFIFKWICPKLVLLFNKIYRYMKKRRNIVHSSSLATVTTVENTVTIRPTADVRNIVIQATNSSHIMESSSRTHCFFNLGIILFVVMIIVLVIVSIYLNRLAKRVDTFTMSSTISTMMTTPNMILSTTRELLCPVTFQLSSTYWISEGSFETFLTFSDFDENGYLDIAFVNSQSDFINTLLGNNDGSFNIQTPYWFRKETAPRRIVTADFNSDGHADLVVMCYMDWMISIFLGNGDGTFQTPRTSSTSPVYGIVFGAAVDFNSDGNLDFILGGVGLCVKFGDGAGGFSPPLVLAANIGISASFIAAGYLNDDDQLDLFVLNNYEDYVKVLLNDGHENFRLFAEFSTERYGEARSLAVSDFNNDHRLDLAIVNREKNNMAVYVQNNNETFTLEMTHWIGAYSYPASIVARDFNNDGQIDLIVSNEFMHNIGIWLGYGDGTFFSSVMFSTGNKSTPNGIFVEDFNNDSKLDLAVVDETGDRILILLNTCTCCVDEVLQQN